jgi:hypothetical protein
MGIAKKNVFRFIHPGHGIGSIVTVKRKTNGNARQCVCMSNGFAVRQGHDASNVWDWCGRDIFFAPQHGQQINEVFKCKPARLSSTAMNSNCLLCFAPVRVGNYGPGRTWG